MEIEVAVPTPLEQTFIYTSETEVPRGTRVLVPFGPRQVVGVALGPAKPAAEEPGEKTYALKAISKVIDRSPIYSDNLMKLAEWMSQYYLHPLGETLRTMLPAANSKILKHNLVLTDSGQEFISENPHSTLAQMFGKKATLTQVTFKRKKVALGLSEDEFKLWKKKGLVKPERQSVWAVRQSNDNAESDLDRGANSSKPELTMQQKTVFNFICQEGLGQLHPKPFLLHGVTGSGKTEVYLHLIEEVLERTSGQGQSLLLVPEISLTPQMTRVFENRFPGQVAVVHSAMADKDRWDRLESIRRGECHILVGPRSAIFGPFKNLRLILVDEEHDSSYKQGSGLLYHGRDVATVRAKLEGATIVLGSATPSMESFYNAKMGKYHYLQMTDRVTGRPLPEVQLIQEKPAYKTGEVVRDLTDIADAPAEIPVAKEVIDALKENGAEGHQAMVLVNRRGYAYYLLSIEKKQAVQCPNCSISLTLHSKSQILRCHYCDYRTTLKKTLEQHPEDSFLAIGFGSEKAEAFLKDQLSPLRVQRLDSDILSRRDRLETILGRFRERKLDVLVGTQILAKGHDFPDVTLICILEVDQLLNLPDFRSGERTFQLLVQAAGRAGRAEKPGKVLVQCIKANDPVVQSALRHDYESFAERELEFRAAFGYPPFRKLAAFECTSPDEPKLNRLCQTMGDWLDRGAAAFPDVTILGPSTPPIATIRGRHRRSILLSSKDISQLRHLAHQFLVAFRKLPPAVRLKLDVDPQSLI